MHSCIIDRIDRYIDKNIFNPSSMTTNENCERLYLIPLPVNSNRLVYIWKSLKWRIDSFSRNEAHAEFPIDFATF